ncbi:MAG: energy transducer TonB [Rhodocyclaceae bacterium]
MNASNRQTVAARGAGMAALWRRWGGTIITVVVVVALVAGLWHLLSGTAATRREAPTTAMLTLPPPPPPPPEPEKLPEPEQEKIAEVTEVAPTPAESTEKPMDNQPPSPAQDMGEAVTIDGDAQAGTDAFGIQAGGGGGMTGSGGAGGLANSSYSAYVTNFLQQTLLRDPRTRHLAFSDVQIDLWLLSNGERTRLRLVRGTGNARTDEAVLAVVRDVERFKERPPRSIRYPIRFSMDGQRP